MPRSRCLPDLVTTTLVTVSLCLYLDVRVDQPDLHVGEPTGLRPLRRIEDRVQLEVGPFQVWRRRTERGSRLEQRAGLVRRPGQRLARTRAPTRSPGAGAAESGSGAGRSDSSEVRRSSGRIAGAGVAEAGSGAGAWARAAGNARIPPRNATVSSSRALRAMTGSSLGRVSAVRLLRRRRRADVGGTLGIKNAVQSRSKSGRRRRRRADVGGTLAIKHAVPSRFRTGSSSSAAVGPSVRRRRCPAGGASPWDGSGGAPPSPASGGGVPVPLRAGPTGTPPAGRGRGQARAGSCGARTTHPGAVRTRCR